MQGQRHLRTLHNDGATVSAISGQCTATEAAVAQPNAQVAGSAVSEHRASLHFKNLCTYELVEFWK